MSSDISLDLVWERSLCSESLLRSHVWWKTCFRFCTTMFSESAPTCEDLFPLQRMEISQQPCMSWQHLAALHSPMSVVSSLVQWTASDVCSSEAPRAHSESGSPVIPKSSVAEESLVQWITALFSRTVESMRLFCSQDAFHPSLRLWHNIPVPNCWAIFAGNFNKNRLFLADTAKK